MVVGLSRHKVGLAAGAKPLRAGLGGRGEASQGNPYGQGPGRCGAGLC